MTGSMRRRLTLNVIALLGLALCSSSIALYLIVDKALIGEFDARLTEDAQALAGGVEAHDDEPWEVEANGPPDSRGSDPAMYFEIWHADGRVLGRSESLGVRDLAVPAHDVIGTTTGMLPDGRAGRLHHALLVPRLEGTARSDPLGHRVRIAVARSTAAPDATLRRLAWLLVITNAGALFVATFAAVGTVRRGLAPLDAVAQTIERLDLKHLAARVPENGLPSELAPTVGKLNALLDRVQSALERERQFAGDASHELRTPLAALRNILEVQLSRERSGEEYRKALTEALAVIAELANLSENLLLLTRIESGQAAPRRESVDLHALVEQSLSAVRSKATARRLTLDNRVAACTEVTSDRDQLAIVLTNLVGNAVDYTAEGGRVVVASDLAAGMWLEVMDSGPPLPDDALERIFDRFVRLDLARSAPGEHSGIGLSVARSACALLGLEISAHNLSDGGVAFRIVSAAAR